MSQPIKHSVAPFAALAVALIAVATLYWNGLTGPFLLDDGYNIPQTEIDSLSWDELSSVAFANRSGVLRRPVSVLSFALNNYLGGTAPLGFKYVNLMLHLLCGLLLFWLGGRLLSHFTVDSSTRRHAWFVAAAAALVWAVHPMQVSTVLYAVQRMAMLAALFNIAALLCYISARQCLIEARPGFTLRAGLFVVFAVLGLLSKETGALIVLYVLAVEVVLLRPADLNAVTQRKLFALIGLVCVLPLALGVLYFVTHTDTLLADYSVREFSLAERLITQPGVLWFYLKLILIPDITLMSVFHDDYPIATFSLFSILQAIGIAVAVFAACLIRRRFALISLGILWFLVSHAVESTVFPLEMVFEHRNYLALWGVFLPLIYYLTPIHAGGRNDRLRIACVAAVMVLLSFQTYTRTNTWSSMQLLSANTVREHPNSARAHSSYSRWLSDTGQYEEALMEVRAAERLDPRYPGYPLSALMLECALDRVSLETIPRIRQTLSDYPVNGHIAGALAWFHDTAVSRDCAAVDKHSFLFVTGGISEFLPRDAIPERRAAALGYLGLAQSMFAEKRTDAIDTFELSFRENPENLASLALVSLLQISSGELEQARQTLQRAKIQNERNITDNSLNLSFMENVLERAEKSRQAADEHSATRQERSE